LRLKRLAGMLTTLAGRRADNLAAVDKRIISLRARPKKLATLRALQAR